MEIKTDEKYRHLLGKEIQFKDKGGTYKVFVAGCSDKHGITLKLNEEADGPKNDYACINLMVARKMGEFTVAKCEFEEWIKAIEEKGFINTKTIEEKVNAKGCGFFPAPCPFE